MPALDRLPPANAHIRPHPLSTTIPRCRADLKAPKSFSAINRKPESDQAASGSVKSAANPERLRIAGLRGLQLIARPHVTQRIAIARRMAKRQDNLRV